LEVFGDDAGIHHGSNDILNREVGGNICGIHKSEGGIKNMEFGRDISIIDESGGETKGTKYMEGLMHLELRRQWKLTVFYTFCVKRKVRIFNTKNLYGNNT
jgi:hypothetical protein